MATFQETEQVKATIAPRHLKFELIQICRGIAAIMVVLYHCNNATRDYFKMLPVKGVFSLGLFGVDFFFVLSGFIITYVHLQDIRKQKNLDVFLKKRFIRIYPIYWVFAIITFLFLVLYLNGKPDLFDHQLQLNSFGDWMYIIKSFALFPQPFISLVDVSWTLTFEVLFYAMFAIAIIAGWKISRLIYFGWIILILLNMSGIFNTENFYFNFVFNPLILEFLMGCLLAYNFRNEIVKLTLPLFLVLAGLLLIASLIYLKGFGHQLGREGFGFVVIVSAAFLALWGSATLDKTNRFKAARLKPMLVVGDASYSIYLTHTLMIRILYEAGFKAFQSFNIAATTLSVNLLFLLIALIAVITGVIFHYVVEKPLLSSLNSRLLGKKGQDSVVLKPA
ncbi:MAG TPA: acyltransferase [Chitinophagaceae bacterium]|jgi:peptidoglycan/LPS O-acetylase OafA/YrhL|nr:acyltransferase [Chitinophagaceae bacterium]